MADKLRCQWGDCDAVATHRATFSAPIEKVPYCNDCLPAVRAALDYEHIKPL